MERQRRAALFHSVSADEENFAVDGISPSRVRADGLRRAAHFLGTLEARSVGVSAVQARYFESWGCLSFGMIPLIGGAGVGALAVLNISASVFRRARFTLRGVGLILTHTFLVVLILAGALQYFLRTEGILVLDAGEVSHEILAGEGNGRKISPWFSVKLKNLMPGHGREAISPAAFQARFALCAAGKARKRLFA